MRSGWPAELIARQCGHRDSTLVLKVYGRFRPTSEELDHWEKKAAAFDEQMFQRTGTIRGTGVAASTPIVDRYETQKALTPWESTPSANSWGETRTPDPGIMSAVL